MSGDVQPRKRKDKKKRKDDDVYSSVPSNEDVNIHVHKDGGTGGNICAKIVFFLLFSALIVLIGLIIKENQGLSELENIEEESRFSQIFEGWIDKTPEKHEDHSPELLDESNEHDEEEDLEDHESEESNVDEDTEEEQSQEEEEEDEDESAVKSEEDEPTEESEEIYQSQEEEEEEIDEKPNDTDEVEDDDDEDDDESKEEDLSREKLKSQERRDIEEDELSKETSEEVKPDDEPKEEAEEDQNEETITEQPETDEKPPKEHSGQVNVGDTHESDSDREEYEHSDITNREDYAIKEEIDAAQQQLDKNAAYANKMFEALLDKYPLSPRSLYGKAKALDILAEKRQSNDLLKQSLNYYLKTMEAPNVPDQLFVIVAERYIDRARFMGHYKKAIDAHGQLIDRFPLNATYLNNLAVTYLTINLIEEARTTLKQVLSRWPDNGFALVHYGFLLKTADNNLEDSIEYMSKGLKTRAPGVIDGRFYFHLGDALTRLNRKEEAVKLYEAGVKEKVFKSKYQRSLYNVERLTAKSWWEPKDIPSYQKLFTALKENWKKIKQEGLSALNEQGYFKDEAENLRDTGTWKQLELFARGQEFSKNCARSPVTCKIIHTFPDASSCRRGQTKFSVMHPGTHVWPHCGPTNCRLRIHLGLKVPPKTFIRVAEETRSWKEGDIIIFDDSFEHEVWHNGSEFRLVLIIDVWHPDLTLTEKNSLSSI